MPELPEVEVVRRGLAAGITGRRVVAVQVLHPRPVRRHLPGPEHFAAELTGRTFAEPCRRGKYLWLPFDDGDALLAHLGMSGQFRLDPADAPLVERLCAEGLPGLHLTQQLLDVALAGHPELVK